METKLELLSYIKKNSEDKRNTTKELINISNNPDFIKLLLTQEKKYEEYETLAKNELINEYVTPESLNPIEKITSSIMVSFGTAIDKSSSNLANLLITNHTESISKLNAFSMVNDINSEEMIFINEYVDFEKDNISELEKYL